MEPPAGGAGDTGGAVDPSSPPAVQRSGRSSPSRTASSASGPLRGQSSTRIRALHFAAVEQREQEVRGRPVRAALRQSAARALRRGDARRAR